MMQMTKILGGILLIGYLKESFKEFWNLSNDISNSVWANLVHENAAFLISYDVRESIKKGELQESKIRWT